MDRSGAGNDFLRRLAIQAGIYLGIFLAGAILAFLYSYIPLHNAKNWKIDYLEERLVAKDTELGELQRKLTQLETDSADKPDGQTFKQLQDELHTTDKTLKDLERQVADLERKARDLEKSRNEWKSKYDDAEASRIAAASSTARSGAAPAATSAGGAAPVDQPAAAAAPGRTIVSDARVQIGTRWRSPDGRSDFDLVAIADDVARVVPNAASLRPGAVPVTRDVALGQHFMIDAPGGHPLRVVVERIDGTSGIVIDVTD